MKYFILNIFKMLNKLTSNKRKIEVEYTYYIFRRFLLFEFNKFENL